MNAMRMGIVAILIGLVPLAAPAAEEHEALALVRKTTDRVVAALRKDAEQLRKDPARLNTLVDDIVLPHFDFERMSQWVLGKHWARASAEQRTQFVGEFRSLLVRTYAKSLLEYRDQEIVFLPLRASAQEGEIEIRTEVQQKGAFPIPINYSLHRKGSAWKVYDVNIDAISLVANYRTTFGNEIRQMGLDGLLKRLRERNESAATS